MSILPFLSQNIFVLNFLNVKHYHRGAQARAGSFRSLGPLGSTTLRTQSLQPLSAVDKNRHICIVSLCILNQSYNATRK